jgi:hypothetical protein
VRSQLRELAAALVSRTTASPDLLAAAGQHGVLGLFPIEHPAFASTVIGIRSRHLRALKFTRRAIDVLTAAAIPAVVLKGVAAGARWPDPTVRQQSDLDLLVDYLNKDRAAEALIAAGVCKERVVDSHAMHNDTLLPADSSGLLVELHHYFSNHHDTRVDIGELLARRITVTTDQGGIPALAPEDDAVFLALHATTHALGRLAWLADLAFLRPHWVEAASRARRWNIALAVEPAWRRARDLLAVPIPDAAFDELDIAYLHRAFAHAILAASDATEGGLHQLFERSFRFSVVPVGSLPTVLVQKLRARREEHTAYARRAKPQ